MITEKNGYVTGGADILSPDNKPQVAVAFLKQQIVNRSWNGGMTPMVFRKSYACPAIMLPAFSVSAAIGDVNADARTAMAEMRGLNTIMDCEMGV